MRIEIFGGGMGSVALLQSGLNDLHTDINTTIDSLKGIQSKLNNISGGVGNLSGALNSLQARIKSEGDKLASVESVSQRTNTFLSNTMLADSQVANLVSQNQEKFFRTHEWLRPVVEEEKSWWEKRVDDWNNFWGSAGEAIKNAFEGIVDFVKEHAVEIIIGAVAIVVGAAIMALSGGTAAAFIPALLAGLKAAAISAVIGGAISGVIALFTGGNVLKAFGDGLASGFMWGGIFFAVSSAISAVRTAISAKNMTRADTIRKSKKIGDSYEDYVFKKSTKKGQIAEKQVTIETTTNTGESVRFKIDRIELDKNGEIILKEIKSSPTATFTKNQKLAFADDILKNGGVEEGILKNGGIIRGAGKGSIFKGGFQIQPGTPIKVIRPKIPFAIYEELSHITFYSEITGGFGGAAYKQAKS